MKYVILISSIVFLFFSQGRKMVYIQGNEYANLVFDEKKGLVNLYIDSTIIQDTKLSNGIKLYVASFFVHNKEALKRKFLRDHRVTIDAFALKNKKNICEVIYYLEHVDHGNLPLHLGRDAYKLLEIKELKPCIDSKRKVLYKKGMLLIDISADEPSKEIEMSIDSTKKNKQ